MAQAQTKNKTTQQGIDFEPPVPDFIPYACHYSPDTLLTKNGELLQIVKITGFVSEEVGQKHQDLREQIRQAIANNVKNADFSLWFTTIRRKKSLDPGGEHPEGFSKKLNASWNDKHKWHEKYVNEVYIAIVHCGMSFKLASLSDVLNTLLFKKVYKKHEKYLNNANTRLTSVTNNILQSLSTLGARKLTIVKAQDGAYYSQPLQFLSKIINLAETPIPVPISDISDYIASHKIAFGFNTMQVSGALGTHFGTIFTIKNYFELPSEILDRFLQLDQEFIVTQSIDFENSKQTLKNFKQMKKILEVSRSDEFSEAIGLDAIVASDNKSETDYGNSQISIFLISETLEALEKNTKTVVSRLNEIGIVATRRDLRMEECYWSQLPANFSFITRQLPINTAKIGGFASLYNFPAGKPEGNHWGVATTIFRTIFNTPYFFSFHVNDCGHTCLMGPKGSGKTVLMNFLLSEAQKFLPKVFFFDQERASKVFIKSLNGYYTTIKPGEPNTEYAFNPLQIPDSTENREFLKKWFMYLVYSVGKAVNNQDKEFIAKLVDYIYQLPQEQRQLSIIAKAFGPTTQGSFGQAMMHWYGKGKYAHLFDNERKSIVPFENRVHGFGMSYVVEDKFTLAPVLLYLFHRIEMALDGTPTIVVLDEAWNLVNNQLFAHDLPDWLDRLKAKNAMVIFASENVNNASKSQITQTLTERIATQIFMPNSEAEECSDSYQQIWGLSESEFEILKEINTIDKEFMLRQEGKSIVAALNLSGMKEVAVLSGGDKTVTIMEEVMAQKGGNPDDWLPAFYEKCSNL